MNPAEEIAALRKQVEQLTHHAGVLINFPGAIFRGRAGAKRLYGGATGLNGPVNGMMFEHLHAQDIVDGYNVVWQATYEQGWAHASGEVPGGSARAG
jgi:hypothetical protein